MWKEVQRTRKKRNPVQSLCRVQSRPSLTTVRHEVRGCDSGWRVNEFNVRPATISGKRYNVHKKEVNYFIWEVDHM